MQGTFIVSPSELLRLTFLAAVSSIQFLFVPQAKRGALKDCPADDMLATVLQATVERTGVEPEVIKNPLYYGAQNALAVLQASLVSAPSQLCDLRFLLQAYGDVVMGSVLGPSSQRANECRIAMFLAGYPETVPVRTVNRWFISSEDLSAQTNRACFISCRHLCCRL